MASPPTTSCGAAVMATRCSSTPRTPMTSDPTSPTWWRNTSPRLARSSPISTDASPSSSDASAPPVCRRGATFREVAMEGGCTCGAVRFRLTETPLVVHCCHCTWCQGLSGTAFALNAWIENDRVELLAGMPGEIAVPAPSGAPFFRFVRVGTLDAPAALPPDVHIYTSTKLPWLDLGDGVPVFEEYYRRSDVWRPEALERFRIAREAAN